MLDLILSIFIMMFGLWGIYASFFIITKEKFFSDSGYRMFREFLALPAKFNYWLLTLFFLFSGIVVAIVGVQLIIREL